MKLNSKHLAAYAADNSDIDKQGYLLKKGEVNKAFQKRWFVLKGNLLFYFERKVDKEPIGVVILEGCTIELAEMTDMFAFNIVFRCGTSSAVSATGRTYTLAAEDQDDLESWMRACACANYDYMRMTLADLQQQLDELTKKEEASRSGSSSASPASASGGSVRRPVPAPRKKAQTRSFAQIHYQYGAKIRDLTRNTNYGNCFNNVQGALLDL